MQNSYIDDLVYYSELRKEGKEPIEYGSEERKKLFDIILDLYELSGKLQPAEFIDVRKIIITLMDIFRFMG